MSNLFKRTSSNWARYDKYEWKEDKEGTLYITPSPDAKVSLYNPLKDSEQIVLKAVNLGLMCMDKNNTQERLQSAIMDFVTCYGLLGFMTALPTTPDFITYHAVYLPKNHFIKEESMTTEKYLSYFFPFDKIDFVKKGMESSWSTDDVQMMALIMTMKNKPQEVMMSFQKVTNVKTSIMCIRAERRIRTTITNLPAIRKKALYEYRYYKTNGNGAVQNRR